MAKPRTSKTEAPESRRCRNLGREAIEGSETGLSAWHASLPWETEFPLFSGGRLARMKAAHIGDHVRIRKLLLATGAPDVEADFSHWLDDPAYEPSDRLLMSM